MLEAWLEQFLSMHQLSITSFFRATNKSDEIWLQARFAAGADAYADGDELDDDISTDDEAMASIDEESDGSIEARNSFGLL